MRESVATQMNTVNALEEKMKYLREIICFTAE